MYEGALAERAARAERLGERDAGLGGRASDYTEELGERICALRAEGATARQIMRTPGMPSYGAIHRWMNAHPEFRRLYRAATEHWAEGKEEEQIAIADGALGDAWRRLGGARTIAAREALALAKLRIDTRERQIARRMLRSPPKAEAEAEAEADAEIGAFERALRQLRGSGQGPGRPS